MEIVTAEIHESKVIGVRDKLTAFFELTKPRIAFMLVLTSAAGFYLGTANGFDVLLFVNSMLGITFLAFGVATLNQHWERKIDLLMERTAKRPLPTKRVSPKEALVFGVLLCLGAEIYLLVFVNVLTAVFGGFVFFWFFFFFFSF